jgi:hypothetical protein
LIIERGWPSGKETKKNIFFDVLSVFGSYNFFNCNFLSGIINTYVSIKVNSS